MNNHTIDNLIDGLSEYDDLDYGGKEWLVDGFLDVLENIHNVDGDFEGRYYTGVMYMVEKGEEIPKLYQIIDAGSAFTNETYELKVMMIKGVRQNKDGDLIMELLAEKIR